MLYSSYCGCDCTATVCSCNYGTGEYPRCDCCGQVITNKCATITVKVEPEPIKERPKWPKPGGMLLLKAPDVPRLFRPRPGRELRHRGGFRNFYKMRD